MKTLAAYLPGLVCGAMLLFVCIPMMRNMHKGHDDSTDADTQKEIAELREEIQWLKSGSSTDVPTKETI